MFLFIIGFILMLYGNFFIISYMNLLNAPYNIFEFILFLFSKKECYFVFIGLILILLSLRKRE